MVRAVLFDAGNTLIFLDYARLAREVGARLGLSIDATRLAETAPQAARVLERGAGVNDRDRASRYLELLFTLAGVPEARAAEVRDALLQMHKERHLWSGVHPETPAALDRLRARGVPLGVVSNSDGRVESALAAAGLLARFDVVIDSALVGVEKPDPAIFTPALAALGVVAADALYVGDIYEVDVVGARTAGLDVVLIDPDGRNAGRDVTTFEHVPAAIAALERSGRLVPAIPTLSLRHDP